jgi:hypothetical protein
VYAQCTRKAICFGAFLNGIGVSGAEWRLRNHSSCHGIRNPVTRESISQQPAFAFIGGVGITTQEPTIDTYTQASTLRRECIISWPATTYSFSVTFAEFTNDHVHPGSLDRKRRGGFGDYFGRSGSWTCVQGWPKTCRPSPGTAYDPNTRKTASDAHNQAISTTQEMGGRIWVCSQRR